MNPLTIIAVMELISRAIKIGGEIVPIALRAYAAIRQESGMTDEQLVAEARKMNDEDAAKLEALIAETGG